VTNSTESEDSRPRATDGMSGHGFYDQHSEAQRDVISSQAATLRNAAEVLDLSGEELRIVDYGCGPGHNSMAAYRTVIDEVRRRNADINIVAMHNDQLGNDWNDLIANVVGPDGYLQHNTNIRVETSVASFFRPVASSGTVDFGMSFAAVHWLERPAQLASPGTLFFTDLPEPARSTLASTADRDWTTFLRKRAREVKPGGMLVLCGLSAIPDPNDPSGTAAAGRHLYRALWRVAADLAKEGRIDPDRLNEFVFPVYFRKSDEIRAPIDREADLANAFEIVELKNELFPTIYEAELEKTGDIKTYAESYMAFARSFAESTLRHGLFESSSTNDISANELSNEYFRQLQELFASEPGRHAFENRVMTLVLRRR